MSVILAIETASSSCSVALRVDGEIQERSEVGNNVHSGVLLDMVDELLKLANLSPQDLDAVAVGQGPGSFTGLRIGVGVGQGLAFGAQCPMIGVSSLDALAMQSGQEGSVIAMLDARMGEVYWCEYRKENSNVERAIDSQVSPPSSVVSDADKLTVVGNAWEVYPGEFSLLAQKGELTVLELTCPSAGALLSLAELKYGQKDWVDAAAFAPIYVRNDVAKKSSKKLPGRRELADVKGATRRLANHLE